MTKEKGFQALTTELDRTNLIEASAGTGKTYSISILVLRCLLEKSIPIEKILLVTFTEDAAKELKSRCARFIRMGLSELEKQESISDETIKQIVGGENRDEYIKKLRQALFDIDKAKISTIHSFCQQTLNEFAFETGQPFGMELTANTDSIVEQELSDYWRREVTGKPDEHLTNAKLTDFDLYRRGVKLSLSGKEFIPIGAAAHQNFENELSAIIPELRKSVNERIRKKNFLTYDNMILSLHEKKGDDTLKKYLQKKYDAVFVDEFQDTDVHQYEIFKSFFQECSGKIVFYIGDPKQSIYSFRNADLDVYSRAKNEILQSKGRVLSMNVNYRSSGELLDKCHKFFRATDNFHPFDYKPVSKPVIDYIEVEAETGKNEEGLKDNSGLLKPFLITETDGDVYEQITEHVKYLLSSNKGLKLNGEAIKPGDIAIILRKNKECGAVKARLSKEKIPAVVIDDTDIFKTPEAKSYLYLLKALLETTENNINAFLMEPLTGISAEELKKINLEELVPLFRKWRTMWDTKGLPAVVEDVRHLLNIQSKWENNPTIGHRILSNIQQLTDILQKQTANNYLTPDDVYSFLKSKIKSDGNGDDVENMSEEYTVRIESDEEAVQILTIHKSKGLEFPIVLLANLELKNKPQSEHKYFSFKEDCNNCFVKYHSNDDSNDDYKHHLQRYVRQQEEENKRLIYVAVTRAKYHVSLFVENRKENNKGGYNQKTVGSIHAYLDALENKNLKSEFIEEDPRRYTGAVYSGITQSGKESEGLRSYPKLVFPDKNYHKLSYSFISGAHTASPTSESRDYKEDSYEHFIFKTLPKGNQTGNLLHQIFEYIDFTSDEKHDEIINRAIARHLPGKTGDDKFKENLKILVTNVLNALIDRNGLSLKQIRREQRINEFEFNFNVPDEINLLKLEYIFSTKDKRIITTSRSTVKGMMNGFIDMFFEHDGKYYILDWKSNFLGDTYEDYSEDRLLQAMNANNYHLQYLIYSVAVDKYLKAKLNGYNFDKHFGGVMYLFLRGLKANEGGGVYSVRLTRDELDSAGKIIAHRLSEES